MKSLLDKIFSENEVEDANQKKYVLHSSTSKQQCKFIADILKELKPENSLEIGLAYGISTIAILEALGQEQHRFHHFVIDPFQSDWHNVGLHYIKRTGFENNVTFYEKYSDEVLPLMAAEKKRIQFVYLDSSKVFDILLTDLHFINKILDINGVIVLDDCRYPGIRKLIRFMAVHPSFEVFCGLDKDYFSVKRKLATQLYHLLLNKMPFKNYKSASNYNYKLKTDSELGVDYRCIAFKKVKEDDRNWDWHSAF